MIIFPSLERTAEWDACRAACTCVRKGVVTSVQLGSNKSVLVVGPNGHERDRDIGADSSPLDYMHARFYSASVGRFVSVDPVVDFKRNLFKPQGWNRYAYVRNNPLRHVDPDGRVVEATGSDADKTRELELIRQNLHTDERSWVTLDKKGLVQIKPGAQCFSVAFTDWQKLVRKKDITELHIAQTAKLKTGPGPTKPLEIDLQTAGGGLTVPKANSLSGNTEVYIDPAR